MRERLVWPISPRVSTFHNTRHSDGSNTVQAPNPGSHRVLGDTSWRSTSQQDELQLNAVNCLQLSAVIWGSSGYFCGKIQALSEGSDCILLDGLDEHQHHMVMVTALLRKDRMRFEFCPQIEKPPSGLSSLPSSSPSPPALFSEGGEPWQSFNKEGGAE